jgi:hypothetical protein
MTIETRDFESSHGRKPRPGQQGCWVFSIGDGRGAWTTLTASGTYREALASAKAEARSIGRAAEIVVCP